MAVTHTRKTTGYKHTIILVLECFGLRSHSVESGSHVPLRMRCEAFTCARVGQSLWQAIVGWSRSLAVLGLFSFSSLSSPIGQVSLRSCQPIVGVVQAIKDHKFIEFGDLLPEALRETQFDMVSDKKDDSK